MAFQHNAGAPGFGQSHDPFAGLSSHQNIDDALDFEDTYDGLGDQLDETDDAFNDDTFGDGGAVGGGGGNDAFSSAPVGKDFDFFGQTAKVSGAIEEEQWRFNRHQPPPKASAASAAATQGYGHGFFAPQPAYQPKPARSGYEKYKDPEPVSELQVDASIWGTAPKKTATPVAPAMVAPPSQPAPPPASRKMMSLEEVEASMRAKAKASTPQPPAQPLQPPSYPTSQEPQMPSQAAQYGQQPPGLYPADQRAVPGGLHGHPVTILQRPSSSKQTPPAGPAIAMAQQQQGPPMGSPLQILQNPNRVPAADAARVPSHPTHRQQGSFGRQPGMLTHPAQYGNMSEDEKAAYLEAEARRAKRTFKINMLSKDNGLMTPQDKSFITRIQLQQLVSATGDPSDHGTDAALTEDFYYQVLSSLRSNQRLHPSQPLTNFAQTYLFQTGSRQGGMRRHGRGPENHMQRMEQQVQRAVEAAKNKPKNKQLVIEGSLGKISFSNAKTPKPLLNIKRNDSGTNTKDPGTSPRPQTAKLTDSKATLKSIENVYMTLLKMDDMARKVPRPPHEGGLTEQEFMDQQAEFQAEFQMLNGQLWEALKVHEPIAPMAMHPFIAFISYAKGKKAIPRVFRHLTHEQRTTILTMIIVHLDQLDVVRGAQVQTGEPVSLNAAMRENIELFILVVLPSLFSLLNDSDLQIVTGVLGLISTKLNVDMVARTRIGLSLLTMILSRAEIIKEARQADEQSWQQWCYQFNQFFNTIEPTLPNVFPGSVTSGEDIYVWQFLAAIGIGASPDEQQRLVLAVKDRVMDTVQMAKTLPADMAKQRLDNVNLFMRSIGLDVELLN